MQPKTLKEDDLYYTDAPVGEILRHVREHYNQSLLDVEKSLRIRCSQIEAIENSDYSQLPGRVYAIGFIRAYAEYLGLDPERIVNMFKNQEMDKTKKPVLDFPVGAPDGKLPNIIILLICIVLLAFSVSAILYLQGSETTTLDTIPSVDEAVEETTHTPTTPDTPTIRFKANKTSWIEIHNSQNETIMSKTLEAGDSFALPKQAGLKLTVGAPEAIDIIINDTNAGAVGEAGSVLRNLPLDAVILKEKYGLNLQTPVNELQDN